LKESLQLRSFSNNFLNINFKTKPIVVCLTKVGSGWWRRRELNPRPLILQP